MAKLSDISHPRERNPQIKAAELENRAFMVLDCTEPITPKQSGKYEQRPFLVFTVSLTEPNREELEVGNCFDLLLSHTQGQRDDLMKYFTGDGETIVEPVGPLTIYKLDVGQPQPMWAFADYGPQPEPPSKKK